MLNFFLLSFFPSFFPFVTTLPYNGSEIYWEQIQALLGSFWNNSPLAFRMGTPHSQIGAARHSKLQSSSAEANYFWNSFINFVKKDFFIVFSYKFRNYSRIILLQFLLPVIAKCLGSGIQSAHREIYMLHPFN